MDSDDIPSSDPNDNNSRDGESSDVEDLLRVIEAEVESYHSSSQQTDDNPQTPSELEPEAAVESAEPEKGKGKGKDKGKKATKGKEKKKEKEKKKGASKPRRGRGTQMQQPADEAEAKMISEEIAGQCRSYFYGVRRKYSTKSGVITRFFAEMRKPDEVMAVSDKDTVNINVKGFETDVEAAVACSVLIHIFKTFVETRRGRDKPSYRPGENDARGVVLQCHTVLVQRQIAKGEVPYPDCALHDEIQNFCKKCVEDFVQIAEDVRKGVHGWPDDPGLADAVRRYLSDAWPYYVMYPPHRIPAEKQSMPSVVKRKFDNLELGIVKERHPRVGWIELECFCEDHPHPARLRWEVEPHPDACICHGRVHYRWHQVSRFKHHTLRLDSYTKSVK